MSFELFFRIRGLFSQFEALIFSFQILRLISETYIPVFNNNNFIQKEHIKIQSIQFTLTFLTKIAVL